MQKGYRQKSAETLKMETLTLKADGQERKRVKQINAWEACMKSEKLRNCFDKLSSEKRVSKICEVVRKLDIDGQDPLFVYDTYSSFKIDEAFRKSVYAAHKQCETEVNLLCAHIFGSVHSHVFVLYSQKAKQQQQKVQQF